MRHRRKFLIIGSGSIGKRHIGNLIELGERDILAFDINPDRRQEARDLFGIKATDQLSDAWTAKPDVAIITTPTSMHVPLAVTAAEHGCHIFIEKPLSHNMNGLKELFGLVRHKGLVTLVGCNMRFHPALTKIKAMLEEKIIGEITFLRCEFGQYLPDWHPQEDYRRGYSANAKLGGGIILDAIHEIDYARWLMGEIDTVACFSGKLSRLEIDTEDAAAMILRFSNGAFGEIHLDYLQRAYSRSCQIIGESGTIKWEYEKRGISHYSAADRHWQFYPEPPDWEPNDMYLDELRHFLRCLRGIDEPCQDIFEAGRVLRIAMAAKESAVRGEFIKIEKQP